MIRKRKVWEERRLSIQPVFGCFQLFFTQTESRGQKRDPGHWIAREEPEDRGRLFPEKFLAGPSKRIFPGEKAEVESQKD